MGEKYLQANWIRKPPGFVRPMETTRNARSSHSTDMKGSVPKTIIVLKISQNCVYFFFVIAWLFAVAFFVSILNEVWNGWWFLPPKFPDIIFIFQYFFFFFYFIHSLCFCLYDKTNKIIPKSGTSVEKCRQHGAFNIRVYV